LTIPSITAPSTSVPPSKSTDIDDAFTRQASAESKQTTHAPSKNAPRPSKFSKEQKERKREKGKASRIARSAAPIIELSRKTEPAEKEPWMINKAALQKKFQGEKWSPRKKLSPDTMDGIRHLHKQAPDKFTTPVLADHFKISPEAVRRILKSKWRPSDEEYEDRMRRWEKRGETIWTNLVDLGVRPPKRWRDMGVGKAERGDVPKWKTRWRNQVAVNDSIDDIPLVDEGPGLEAWGETRPIAERIL
jgi:hypothetical protein